MYQTKLSAGLDLCSVGPVNLRPLERAVVDTGVYLKDVMPEGFYYDYGVSTHTDVVPCAMVCSRSGLAAKEGVIVLNAPGIVDADYQDTIKVILFNTGDRLVRLTAGARIAQIVFAYAYRRVELIRGEDRQGGLGSTDRENRTPGSTDKRTPE